MKILLVEDNQDISKNIKEYLELEDYSVTVCNRGDDGLDEAIDGKYNLILLDVMLPGIDGFRIAEKVNRKSKTPIIMITAKDSIDDKLTGFDNGVIDYIVKPFDLRELLIRINLVLKKDDKSDTVFSFKDIELDMKKRIFIKADNEINITQKEFLILECLLKNKENPVSRIDLIEYVWGTGDIFGADGKLDVYISNIRKKIDKDLIKTIKGMGYKIL